MRQTLVAAWLIFAFAAHFAVGQTVTSQNGLTYVEGQVLRWSIISGDIGPSSEQYPITI